MNRPRARIPLHLVLLVCFVAILSGSACRAPRGEGVSEAELAAFVRDNYTKAEYRIPMRDGVHLFTSVYSPKDTSQTYPILMRRTPYSVAPYGESDYPGSIGPSEVLARDLYIFVYQDVRGCFMSEGTFVNMTPHLTEKATDQDIDESTDTYDTIEWLIDNVDNNNGKVGLWGISYPGFYAASSMIDAHPALAASSPQAPIADWWYDDFHHHGATFLPHAFGFLSIFGQPRPELTTQFGQRFVFPTPDGYQFFLDLGSLANVNERYFNDTIAFWTDGMVAHPNYDQFWQSRNILPHLNNVAPAVMTVGGWFDAEDLYGPLNIYRSIEEKNPDAFNILVMGPWVHGGWARTTGEAIGDVRFGAQTSLFYRESIEAPFFNYYLKGEGQPDLPEAYVFETGTNQWRTFDDWPPQQAEASSLYLTEGGRLSFEPPDNRGDAYDEYESDPANPVPYTSDIATGMTQEYMTDDQRFASRRPDVLVYQTEVLEEDITLVGPLLADLWVSTSGTGSDWIVKLIDVLPPDAPDPGNMARGKHMGDYHMMVRSESIRGRFRNDPANPEPFIPHQPTMVELPLQDVLHTFKAGHRIMIHVQSTWFPLVDRNPQTYVENIFLAQEEDFIKASQRVYRSAQRPSQVRVSILPQR
jgi:putative CocE/NonD family hydrolase